MDHGKVLKRAWEILWRYRVLWVFGIILALTAGAGTAGNPVFRGDGDGRDVPFEGWGSFAEIPPEVVSTLIAIGIAVACLIVILTIVRFVVRYVAETALIRMVDDHEQTGEKRGVRQGFRLGWSRTALRLFVIDLLTGLPVLLILLLLFLLGAGLVGLMIWADEANAVVVTLIGLVAAIGFGFLLILLAIVVGLVLSLLKQFFWRVCALEEMGVIDSMREGFNFVKRHLKDVVIMWLIMIGLQIGWTIVMIPVAFFLLFVAAVLAGLPALLVGGLASLVLEGAVPWILAAIVGIPIFILVMAVPLTFLGGLAEVFKSSVWTLTYRELRALEGLETESGAADVE